MKRSLLIAGAAVVAAILVVVAPALSLGPYQPAPVEFELVPPGSLHPARAGVVTSAPLRAPKRFNLVGLHWSGAARPQVELRVRSASRQWSAWQSIPSDLADGPDAHTSESQIERGTAPVWAGDAEYVQYRLSQPVTGLRIDFVNTLGTANAAARATTAIRTFVNGALIDAAHLFEPSAQASPSAPPIQPRSAWGGRYCRPRAAPQYGQVKAAIVHHTDTLTGYSPGQVPAMILAICRYHRDSNHWNDIGYNFVVDKFGRIYEGRAGGTDKPVTGAQAQGYNAQSSGIAVLGTYMTSAPPQAAMNALASLIAWKLPFSGAPTFGSVQLVSSGGADNKYPRGATVTIDRVSGHRDVDSTDCPGDALYARLPGLRAQIGALSPPALAPTALSLRATPRRIHRGQRVQVSGRLLGPGGAPVSGVQVSVAVFRVDHWHTLATAYTDSQGYFVASITGRPGRALTAFYAGDGSHLAAESNQVVLRRRGH